VDDRPWELQHRGNGIDRVVVILTVDVEPEELTIAKLPDLDLGEFESAVVTVGIEQPGGDGAQLTRASSSAAPTAIAATRYWRTSIPRSEVVGSAPSIAYG
jgi:hypothetical protein